MREELRRSAAHVFVDDITDVQLSDEDLHHLGRVMRLRHGEVVSCSDGRGRWRLGRWCDGVECETEIFDSAPRVHTLTVAIVPLKGDRSDLVVEKLVEIGIDRIVVLEPTEFAVVRWSPEKSQQALERYRRIVRAAAMQSRQVFLPEVAGPISLAALVNTGEQVALAEPGGETPVSSVQTLIIGPEGGFSATERDQIPAKVDLGSSILRADTAAIVGAALMVAHRTR